MEQVRFEGNDGRLLVGTLYRPVGAPRATALFAHCFSCAGEHTAASGVCLALAQGGLATLCVDFASGFVAEAEGDEANAVPSGADLLAAASYLRDQLSAPQLLIGHSLAGAALLALAPEIPESNAVVTIGAPCDPKYILRLLVPRDDKDPDGDVRLITLGARTFPVEQQFLNDLAQELALEGLPHLGRALLVMHSPIDNVIGVDNARCIFIKAKHPKSFISLDNADHLLRRAADATYAGQIIAGWAARYLEAERVEPELGHGDVEVRGGAHKYTNEVFMAGHRAIADEPISVGGADMGPAPYEYLLAGLGACTSMTLRMYADRKQWPLDQVSVRLTHQRIHAEDCSDCENQNGSVDVIERVVRIEGPLSDEQRQRLLEIANKCPVHRTLSNEIKIRTRAADE